MRSDAELVKAVLSGDRGAFADIVRRYERTVRIIARSFVPDHHTAEDVAQETFLAAYRKLGSLRSGAALGAWIARIARRQAVQLGRRASAAATAELVVDPPAGTARLDDESRRLLAEVWDLPSHERAVVMMRYFERRTAREIAEVLDRPVGTVTKQLSRAYEHLRRRMREWQR